MAPFSNIPSLPTISSWKVMALASIAALLVQLDGSELNIALPAIERLFGVAVFGALMATNSTWGLQIAALLSAALLNS